MVHGWFSLVPVGIEKNRGWMGCSNRGLVAWWGSQRFRRSLTIQQWGWEYQGTIPFGSSRSFWKEVCGVWWRFGGQPYLLRQRPWIHRDCYFKGPSWFQNEFALIASPTLSIWEPKMNGFKTTPMNCLNQLGFCMFLLYRERDIFCPFLICPHRCSTSKTDY